METETSKEKTSDNPRTLKIRVSISRREDLRVKVGDKLNAGDVIADRNKERNALVLQKQQAEITLNRLQTLKAARAEELQKPVTPDATFAENQAAIRRAQVSVDAAKRNVGMQETHISQIANLPFPGDLSKIKQHETARLALLKGELLEAESNLALERAKLETAKANRSYSEQKDTLEIQKQKITLNEQHLTLETNIAQFEAQITNLNAQIIALSAVRAPFAGTIKKITWEGQTNDEINVVILVDVDNGNSDSGAK
ncbi:MAG: hypothetical protein H0X49_04905 [Acidobacteria bacterium]|nr:hypothetical protein [Acidobacteriota bacterium]